MEEQAIRLTKIRFCGRIVGKINNPANENRQIVGEMHDLRHGYQLGPSEAGGESK